MTHGTRFQRLIPPGLLLTFLWPAAASGQALPAGPVFTVDRLDWGSFCVQPGGVCADADGNFVVAWSRDYSVVARRYGKSGNPQGPSFQIDDAGYYPVSSRDQSGNFVVVWATDESGVFGQRFNVPKRTLLRNSKIRSLDPGSPPLASILPLDASGPVPTGDVYVEFFASGWTDPEADVVGDTAHPLVFYGLDSKYTLSLVKTAGGKLRLTF
jgi:hypothetical protein